ncbi:hypothetical protein SAMN02746098_04468 [Desulfosporosinus lacus DSM 15449]|uniref:Uncharacterized protein n=1 Tax=Desulfosporosinus lacus DSM 15449 TaxID=1121420 RepID=A0A1M6D3R0_9FIRM|nr:hypothetical protein SAMN02746098_04468 [Desulfosporosinus lacus DSM 15449]
MAQNDNVVVSGPCLFSFIHERIQLKTKLTPLEKDAKLRKSMKFYDRLF